MIVIMQAGKYAFHKSNCPNIVGGIYIDTPDVDYLWDRIRGAI